MRARAGDVTGTYSAAAETNTMNRIPLNDVQSSQIAAIGHDPKTDTLAIRFKTWKGEPSSLYHYANFTADDFAAFEAAESKGRHFGQHIKAHPDKYPYTRIEAKPAAPIADAA